MGVRIPPLALPFPARILPGGIGTRLSKTPEVWESVFEREESRVAVLDHHGGAGQGCEIRELVLQGAIEDAGSQVGQGLPFNGGDQPAARHQAVVAAGQGPTGDPNSLASKVVGVALADVDDDVDFGMAGGPGRRCSNSGPGLLAGPGALPEHHLAAASVGVDELGSVLPRPRSD